MSHDELLQASSRVALAAFLHDIGKFAERAKINIEPQMLEDNKQRYCPHHKQHEKDKGWFSHVHAAYTGIAVDILEDELKEHIPKFIGENVYPFGSWKTTNVDDSLINAAAAHHKPDTFLQWIIATADRIASGFERDTFEQYNKAEEKNHYQSRQLTLFEAIHQPPKKENTDFNYRYKLKPLSPASIFPVLAQGYEPKNDTTAQAEYLTLWEAFKTGLQDIPPSHRQSLPLWLDHFDSCWQTYTHNIPSATAFNTKADVSLYDHSKAVAALAVALWRYHEERKDDLKKATANMREYLDWKDEKLLLIQGDFFGIQNFIFAQGGDSTKKAAKLLRGRSFYVSLITECAALKILETLALPSTSQIMNAAGKFLIVAPNTDETKAKLKEIQQEFNQWFLKYSYGQSGLGLAWQEACCNDFVNKKASEHDEKTKFEVLMKKLHVQLELSKYQHFDLCSANSISLSKNEYEPRVFKDYLIKDFKPCAVNSRSPATREDGLSNLARDQINIGKWLVTKHRLFIANQKINGDNLEVAETTVFNFYIHFTKDIDHTGNFSKEVREGIIRRAFDFSRPECDDVLWNGYARRNIGGYVPYFKAEDEWDNWKYEDIDKDDLDDKSEIHKRDIPKTLNHLAREDLWINEKQEKCGIKALSVLKGDIDNLGAIFQNGLEQPTFAKMAALSRQVNNFFAVYLPYLCQTKKEYQNTYIVFAGGDDFFLLGSWKQLMSLASELRAKFQEYVAKNPDIHFSAGLTVMKPKIPIYQLAEIAEESLEKSKAYKEIDDEKKTEKTKNAITCFGKTVSWDDFDKLTKESYDRLNNLRKDYELSTGYIYGLLKLVDMASDNSKPENSLWRSQLYYRTYRMVANKRDIKKDDKKRVCEYLIKDIGEQGIQKFKQGGYQITLHAHLYTHRKQS